MTETSRPRDRAVRERAAGNLHAAGEWYTSAAFQNAGKTPLHTSSGRELQYFLAAATCYRIAGRMDRCRNRCHTGILRAEDLSERALSGEMPERANHHADRGGWQESIGMLRLVGDLDGVDKAYDRAFEVFEAAGDPLSHRAERPKTSLYAWFRDLELAATGDVLGMDVRQQQTYTEYASHVRKRIPEYLATLQSSGRWDVSDSVLEAAQNG